ncbi:MAG: hypothetical protein LBO20_02345 [Bifidobacteriaceae bacterium]|jgi:hypothetical protein|nr:hypothetical protein [Bifidobacteriaceae bacterium]
MLKTSVYLSDAQRAGLAETSRLTGKSAAELIRDGVDQVIHDHLRRRPPMQPAFHCEDLVGRVDDLLEDLGT